MEMKCFAQGHNTAPSPQHRSDRTPVRIEPMTVFLFGILRIGVGPSELGKTGHEIWKLGKVEMYLKPLRYSNHVPRDYKIELPCIYSRVGYRLQKLYRGIPRYSATYRGTYHGIP